VLTETKDRGTGDVCIVVCDGLKGLPEAIETTWPLAVIRTCVLHLIRMRSGWRPVATGTRWPVICGRCTPPRPNRPD